MRIFFVGFFLFVHMPFASGLNWTTATNLVNLQSSSPSVAFSSASAIAGWTGYNGSSYLVQAADYSNGSWSPATTISSGSTPCLGFQLVFDGSGNASAIWERSNGTNYILQTATKSSGGSWSSVTNISLTGQDALSGQIVVSPSGTATAIWVQSDGTVERIYASTRTSGVWSTPATISNPDRPASSPRIAISPVTGNVYAVWVTTDTEHTRIQVANTSSGTWGSVSTLSASTQDADSPAIAVDGLGNVTAIWERYNGSNVVIQYSTIEEGGMWPTSGTNLSATGQDARSPQIVATSSTSGIGVGQTVAVWSRSNGANMIIQSQGRGSDLVWETAADLSATGQDAILPQVAINSSGDAAVTWLRYDGASQRVQGASQFYGLPWSSITTLSGSGEDANTAQIAVDGSGNAAVVWGQTQ